MNVLKKLIDARVMLQAIPLNKSGVNEYAKYKYFELVDFLPSIQTIFCKLGLVDVISYTDTLATMIIFDTEDGSSVSFTSPMGSANLKGCHEVQNIGAVTSYQRRYLYTTALAIVENDVLDSKTGDDGKNGVHELRMSTTKEVIKVIEPKKIIVEVDPVDNTLLLGKLIEWAEASTTEAELKSIWKANQSKIDDIKSSDMDGYKRLQARFAELKLMIKGE